GEHRFAPSVARRVRCLAAGDPDPAVVVQRGADRCHLRTAVLAPCSENRSRIALDELPRFVQIHCPYHEPMGRRAAFFDLDKTLIPGSSLFLLARGAYARDYYRVRDIMRFGWRQLTFRMGG